MNPKVLVRPSTALNAQNYVLLRSVKLWPVAGVVHLQLSCFQQLTPIALGGGASIDFGGTSAIS